MYRGLKSRVIIVTGSNGLIGKEVVKELLAQKVKVVGLDIPVETEKEDYDYKQCDITDKNKVDQCFEEIFEKYQRIDGLVNLAYPRTQDWGTHFEEEEYSSWKENVDMQLNSVFYLCQKTIKIMKAEGSGSIVNVSSIYGVVGNDFTIYKDLNMNPPAAYSAVKAGIINFTRYLASLYGKDKIRINCVSPGGILNNQDKEFVKRYQEKVPMKRMGNPDDIAPPISFLLSEDAKYITGQNLIVDGGWTAI